MSKFEFFITILLGFFIFSVLFFRLGFFVGEPIGRFSLILAFVLYLSLLFVLFYWNLIPLVKGKVFYSGLSIFVAVIFSAIIISIPISKIYDTSWDGQGYHQTAVIALANGWNPIRESSINLQRTLPSQIFAEGYPSALWEIEASIYALSNKINSAKILNFLILVVSCSFIYIMLRRLSLNKFLSLLISISISLQPVFTLQMFTFMADGFGFQLALIAIASLVIISSSKDSYWAIWTFLSSILLLASTKYSHLPIVLVIFFIFVLIFGNRLLNREYKIDKWMKGSFVLLLLISLVFAYLPYGRNYFAHKAMFYPTNIPDLMGSVKYNNVPKNLKDKDKPTLLFYGIFSKAQSFESGDPTNEENIANLKVPFTFTFDEVKDAATLYNNRVGAGGPLFSGIVISSLVLLVIITMNTKNRRERYGVYSAYFTIGVIIFLSLLAPTPNLMRYVNQLQMLPFVVIALVFALNKKGVLFKPAAIAILTLTIINSALYMREVAKRVYSENRLISTEFTQMRKSQKTYAVNARHFYSNYILLKEENIPFLIVDYLECDNMLPFPASSRSSFYCPL